MTGLIMVAQLLLAVLIIAGLHEWGHMLAARLFGIRVEQFSIGFPPRIFVKKWKDTVYILGAIPLGGYVKLSGMVDESMDTKQLQEAPKPYEFRSKPAWQRLIVMLGGIFMNLLTGVLVFAVMSYVQGERYLPAEVVQKHGIEVNELGEELGLRTGDKIVSVNGASYTRFEELVDPKVFLKAGAYYEVLREGQRITIAIPPDFVEHFSSKASIAKFILPRMPFRIAKVVPGSAADKAGLQAGDSILSFAGEPVRYIDELRAFIRTHAHQSVALQVLRPARPPDTFDQRLNLLCKLQGDTLGIFQEPRLPYAENKYSLAQGLVVGTQQAFTLVWLNMLGIAKMIKGHISPQKSLAGPIGIAQMFGGKWKWQRFWYLVGLISVFVAIFNLLPIPALDGGHVAFCLYEMITQRSLPIQVLKYAQTVGMVLLIGLMVFVIFNDLWKLF